MTDIIVARHVETATGNSFDIPYVVKRLADLSVDDLEFAITLPKSIPNKTTPTNANVRARVNIRCLASDGKKYRILLRTKTNAVRGLDSYPPTEEDETKQTHSVRISPISEIEKEKLMNLHRLIVEGVFINFKLLFNKSAPKSIDVANEMCACPVKEGEAADGDKYPPMIRLKVKPDVNGKPNIDIYRMKDGKVQAEPERMETYAELKNTIPRGVDQVITFEPTFYISGSNYGWSLIADSMLFQDNPMPSFIAKPMYSAEDVNMLLQNPADSNIKCADTDNDTADNNWSITNTSINDDNNNNNTIDASVTNTPNVVETIDSDDDAISEIAGEQEIPPPTKAKSRRGKYATK